MQAEYREGSTILPVKEKKLVSVKREYKKRKVAGSFYFRKTSRTRVICIVCVAKESDH